MDPLTPKLGLFIPAVLLGTGLVVAGIVVYFVLKISRKRSHKAKKQ